jgi:NitT/TauT family transport system substrate-binding protein
MAALRRRTALAIAGGAVASAALHARADDLRELRIAIQYGIAYLPLLVADREGLFTRALEAAGIHGVTVEVRQVGSSTAINDALISGAIEMGVYGSTALLIAWDRTRSNLGIKGIGGISLTPYTLLANKPEIHTVADFGPNDKIALTSTISPQATLLRMAAERAFGQGNHARLDSAILSLAHPDALNALIAGTDVTAYFSTPPYTALGLQNPRIHRVITSQEILGGKCTGAALGALTRFVERNPAASRAVFEAIDQADALIRSDPRKCAEIYLSVERQRMSVDEVAAQLGDPDAGHSLTPNGIQAFADFMARTGQLRTRPQSWKDVFFPYVHDREGS